MSINYNTNWLNGSYENDVFHFIGWFENPALMTASGATLAKHLRAHFEGTSIAIGFGYDLIQHRNRAQSDLAAVGITLTNEQVQWLNLAASSGPAVRSSIAILLANQGVVLPTRTAAVNLFQNFRRDYFEGELDRVLRNKGFTGTLPESRERLALLSLIYAGRLTDRGSASNPARNTLTGIAHALQGGNRQEAWFWIRYRSNYAGKSEVEARNKDGYTKRAYAESELFGIFDNENVATLPEAQNIYKILQAHRAEIFAFETLYGTDPNSPNNENPTKLIYAANRDFSLISGSDYEVKTIVAELNPARTAIFEYLYGRTDLLNLLISKLTEANIASTNIYLNPHKPTDTDRRSILDSLEYQTRPRYENGANDLMIGMDQEDYMYAYDGNDVLIGEGGDDVLVGGAGDDVLWGGGGGDDRFVGGRDNDTMYGGADDDTYFVGPGVDIDTIEDKEGDDTVILCDKEIKFFCWIDGNTYKSLDGRRAA